MQPTSSHIQAAKKATNVSLTEAGVAKAVSDKRAEIWLKYNAKVFECWNSYVEKKGLPLEKYRSF